MKYAFKNYMGSKLTDDQLQDIPYPRTELVMHVTARTFQVGCIASTLFGALTAKQKNVAGICSRIYAVSPKILLPAVALGPIMTFGVLLGRKADSDSVVDRCYRLRRNKNQMRIDRFSDAGAVAGIASGVATGNGILAGVCVGVTVGVAAGTIYNNKFA